MVVTVWQVGGVGTVGPGKMPEIKGYIEGLVDDFAKELAAANP
jgi:hypothetical protein